MGLVLEVANLPVTEQKDRTLYANVRSALEDVLKGGSGTASNAKGLSVYQLPRLGFMVKAGGGTAPHVERPTLPERGPHFDGWLWDVAGHESAIAAVERELHAVVMALAVDPMAQKLRCCDWSECRRFFFARANHRREHSFCSEAHRRAFDLAARDPKETASYMRRYRQVKARLARRGKGRKR